MIQILCLDAVILLAYNTSHHSGHNGQKLRWAVEGLQRDQEVTTTEKRSTQDITRKKVARIQQVMRRRCMPRHSDSRVREGIHFLRGYVGILVLSWSSSGMRREVLFISSTYTYFVRAPITQRRFRELKRTSRRRRVLMGPGLIPTFMYFLLDDA